MRGETWKNLLGIDNIPNRSTVYEVTESVSHTAYFKTLLGQIAALARSHMDGSVPFDSATKQTTEAIAPKQ